MGLKEARAGFLERLAREMRRRNPDPKLVAYYQDQIDKLDRKIKRRQERLKLKSG